jgi:hypothetical protein
LLRGEAGGTVLRKAKIASKDTRIVSVEMAALVHQGQSVTGTKLLATMILFENWIDEGGDAAAAKLGWDIVKRPPVHLRVVQDALQTDRTARRLID